MKRLIGILFAFSASAFLFVLYNLLAVDSTVSATGGAGGCKQNEVRICHATGSDSNPYVENCPSKSGDLNGHDGHSNDIIPSFSYLVWEKTGSHWECPDHGYGSFHTGMTCKKWIGGHWKWAYAVKVDDYDWVEHQYPGKNWDVDGQTIWNNDCVPPTSSVTPPTETPPSCPTSYSCEACLEYPYPDDDCYSSIYDYCVGTYNCRWEPSNGVLRAITISDSDYMPEGQWVCDCPTQTVTPTPTSEPSRGGGPVGAPVCNDAVPPTPSIVSAVKLDFDTVKLTWNKVSPANDYAILYGTKSGDYPYAVFSTGNTDNFDINGITDGCFIIKAINGCMPGPLSTEVCTGATGGQVLGASTLGSTGSFAADVNMIGFALGFVLGGFGIRKASSKKVQ